MMNRLIRLNLFIGLCLLVFICSCEDIILTDIQNAVVELNTPSDSLQTMETLQMFWWKEVEGANSYELTIVSPDMQAPNVLTLDTIITKTKFSFQLSPGKYEWCVKGLNEGYETSYSCRHLIIAN